MTTPHAKKDTQTMIAWMKAGRATRCVSAGGAGRLPLWMLLLTVCFSVFPAFAQEQSSAAAARGQKSFEQNCAFCHGADATGGRGPDLLRSPVVADDINGNLIGAVIRSGRPDQGMPALHLSDQEIAGITAFLHLRFKQGIESAHLPKNYSLKWLLTGDATAGKAYFDGAGGCKACHSPGGDLAHVASQYTPLKLEAAMLYPSRASRTAPVTVTVTLSSGQQITGQLVHIDEFSVGLRDDSGWYRSFSSDHVKVEVHDPLAAHRELLNKITQDEMHNLFAFLETLK